tara:strand:- start:32 stop:985 length:954 start_codon:yes stop_codon:yes gene_type:complete
MAAIQIAKASLTKKTVNTEFLDQLLSKEFIDEALLQRIKQDKDLIHFFPCPTKKKIRSKKSSDRERNDLEYDSGRCCARVWKAEGGLGFDNIQCNSKNFVPQDKVAEVLGGFEMSEEKKGEIEDFADNYGGCYCKKHLSMHFLMPNGYWLGNVNEPRPEKPMLPAGSLKKGFTEDFKEHTWMFDENGEKVERKRKSSTKNKDKDSTKNNKKGDDGIDEDQLNEFLAWKAAEKEAQNKGTLDIDEENIIDGPEEGDFEDKEYTVDGVEYINHWLEDKKKWTILEPVHYTIIGSPDGKGGINFTDDDEKGKHEAKAEDN